MTFSDALQIILVSVCTGFGLELAKETFKVLAAWARGLKKKLL